MKKRFLAIAFFSTLLLFASSFLAACTKKPWDYDNVVWYSEQPEIEITKEAGENWIGYIMVDDNKVQIELLWGPTHSFNIIDVANSDMPISNDTVLLGGKVRYNKDASTLIINTDNLFSNQYEQIVLSRRDI